MLIGILLASAMAEAALAGPQSRRENCPRIERQSEAQRQQAQQQQSAQAQRRKNLDCRPLRPIPALVDPTPFFIL